MEPLWSIIRYPTEFEDIFPLFRKCCLYLAVFASILNIYLEPLQQPLTWLDVDCKNGHFVVSCFI